MEYFSVSMDVSGAPHRRSTALNSSGPAEVRELQNFMRGCGHIEPSWLAPGRVTRLRLRRRSPPDPGYPGLTRPGWPGRVRKNAVMDSSQPAFASEPASGRVYAARRLIRSTDVTPSG